MTDKTELTELKDDLLDTISAGRRPEQQTSGFTKIDFDYVKGEVNSFELTGHGTGE